MPQLNADISFDGNCAEAMQFYAAALDGRLEALLKNSPSPLAGQLPPGSADLVMHARLALDGGVLAAFLTGGIISLGSLVGFFHGHVFDMAGKRPYVPEWVL